MRALVLVALVACKGGSAPPVTTGSAGSGSGSGSGSAAPATPVGTTIAAATALDGGGLPERCAEPCRYLTDTALADVSARYRRECNDAWPFDQASCDAPLFMVNCIYAAHGYVFKRPEWKEKFEHASWYHPRADFRESELSALENASIHELKQRDKACHASAGPVSDADRALVTQAFVGFDDSTDPRLRNLRVSDQTTMRYGAKDGNKRTITVEHPYLAVDAGTYVDMSLDLVFDGAKLVDVSL